MSGTRSGRPLGEGRFNRRQFVRGGLGLAFAATSLGAAACGSSSSGGGAASATGAAKPTVKPKADGDLTWMTWSEYIPDSVIKSFEKEYGVKVTQSFMTSDEQYVQKLAAGEPIDLITSNSAYLPQSVAGKLLQTFDPGDLKNFDQNIPFFQHPFYDNEQYRYTVPYGYGPTGIMYRTDKIPSVSETWNDLWNHPEAKGHIFILDQIEETLGMSLVRNGHYLNSGNPAEVQKAADNLLSLKPSLGGITTDIQTKIANGDAWLMHAWGTNTFLGIQQSKTPDVIKFYLPKDGAPVACDCLSIGAKAKSPGTALLMIDWILRPDNNAALAKFALQKTGGKAGNAAFDDAVKQYPMFKFDDAAVLNNRKLWKIAPTGSRLQLYNQQWSRVNA
jgi:spermidine/putrescine transport system substrate-binding protein